MTSPSRFKKKFEAGFGLLQVVFILLTIAIAASVAVMSNAPQMRSAGPSITYKKIDLIKSAATRYRADGNGTPASLDALTTAPSGSTPCAPDTNPSSATFRQLRGWCGPYLDREAAGSDLSKRDGWNTLLQYTGSTLVSCGPNRACGDADDISTAL